MRFGLVGDDRARVVFPLPGGPHRMIDENNRSASMARRNNRPCPTISFWPINSFRVRGRMRAANGASSLNLFSNEWSNRSRILLIITFLASQLGVLLKVA